MAHLDFNSNIKYSDDDFPFPFNRDEQDIPMHDDHFFNTGPNNNIENLTEPLPAVINDIRDEKLAKIEILILCVILVLAIIGNGLMLLALHRQLKFRPMSRMYYFMLNLSLADLLVAFGHILPQLAWDITFRFKGNDILCRTVKFLQIFVIYLSTFILTSMAFDRYMVVCHQTFSRNHYSGIKGPRVLIIASWVLSVILASPQSIIFSYQEVEAGIYDCWVNFVKPWDQIYVTWFVVWAFILPLLVMVGSYGAICLKVISFRLPSENNRHHTSAVRLNGYTRHPNKMNRLLSSSSEKTSEDNGKSTVNSSPSQCTPNKERQALKRQLSQAKIKTLKLTLVIVICFFICFAPFCITQLIMVYNPPNSSKDVAPIKVIFLLLASLNSCTNPWIYLFFSESLCNQLRMCLRIGLLRGTNDESIGDEQVIPIVPKPQVKKHLDPAPINLGIIINVPRSPGDDGQMPDTKSEALQNTSKEKDGIGADATLR